MQVIIKVLKGEDCKLEVQSTDTINNLKSKIEKALNIPVLSQKVIYMGRTLNDEGTIDSYRIKDGGKINLIIAQKPELRDVMYKSFRKHYNDATAEKLAKEFVSIFNTKLQKMSLDDIERLSADVLKKKN